MRRRRANSEPRRRRVAGASHPQRLRSAVAFAGVFGVLVCTGALAMGLSKGPAGNGGLLPPLPERPASHDARQERLPAGGDNAHAGHAHGPGEKELAPAAPGAASLAGPPASVVRRFARNWANRDALLTPADRREMVGLSAGAWAGAVFRKARLTLPAIEGARVEGGVETMRLRTVAPGSRTALVVTRERLRSPEGTLAPPRYVLYLARLDRVSPRGYAITAWEPQQ